MDLNLLDVLSPNDLRLYGGGKVFERGSQYYRLERVRVDRADLYEAECTVWGTHIYHVKLFVYQEDLGAMCTCPQADSGWFCKHMVAAGLAVHAHLKAHGPASWRLQVERLVERAAPTARKKQATEPFWLFFTLQPEAQGWKLEANCLYLDATLQALFDQDYAQTIASLPELVTKDSWILKQVKTAGRGLLASDCLNAGQTALSFVSLMQHSHYTGGSYLTYYQKSQPLGEYLSFLAQIDVPLYLARYQNPLSQQLRLLAEAGEISLALQRSPEGLHITAFIQAGAQRLPLVKDEIDTLTFEDPYWLMVGDTVLPVQATGSKTSFYQILRQPQVFVPDYEEPEFLQRYFNRLLEQFHLEGDQLQWHDVAAEPQPRLYLSDEGGELLANLR
ncbi:MAG: hypothetical protein JW862_12105, partial [Anaerolineales bacterium]|nr:hypothetical protein [Anaerolineales bacterium]